MRARLPEKGVSVVCRPDECGGCAGVVAVRGDRLVVLLGLQRGDQPGRRDGLRRAGPLFVVEGAFEAALLIAAGDIADRLPGQRQSFGNLRRALSFGQRQQSHGAKHHADLFAAAAQELLQRRLILGADLHTQSGTRPTSSMPRNISIQTCLDASFSGGQRTSPHFSPPDGRSTW